jgi:hypothetical protein
MNKYLRLGFQITAKVTEEVNFLAYGTPTCSTGVHKLPPCAERPTDTS